MLDLQALHPQQVHVVRLTLFAHCVPCCIDAL
jgi:hypothetical protein